MNSKTLTILILGALTSGTAFGKTCTGSGYQFVGTSSGGTFSGGQFYQGSNAEKIVKQKGHEEDKGSSELMSNDGLVSIDLNDDDTATASVFVNRQNGSSARFTLNCK